MEEVRDHISESMKVLERKMRSEFRLMVQDPSQGGVQGGSRGSITGGTGTHCILHYMLYFIRYYATPQCSKLYEFICTVFLFHATRVIIIDESK